MLACLQKMHLLVPIRFIFTNIHFLNQYSCFPNQTSHSQPIFYTRLVHVTYQISYFKEICIDISGDFSVHILTCHRHFMKCQIDFKKCTRFFKVLFFFFLTDCQYCYWSSNLFLYTRISKNLILEFSLAKNNVGKIKIT